VPYSEQSLASRILDDDPEALGQVIRWISLALTSPRFWQLRSEWPDLVQEVLARVVESLRLERFQESRDFRAYVQGIARFACLQSLAKRVDSVSGSLPDRRVGSGAWSLETRAIQTQMARRVLDLASEECRELFRKYYFEGENYEAIASSMGIPVGTVKSRLFRCLRSAYEILGSGGLEKPRLRNG